MTAPRECQPDSEDAFDALLFEADWTDMHGGDHHDDDCSICRDIAKVRAVFEENRKLRAQRCGVLTATDIIRALDSPTVAALARVFDPRYQRVDQSYSEQIASILAASLALSSAEGK